MGSSVATRRLVWSIFGFLLVLGVALGTSGAWTSDVGAEDPPQVTTDKIDYAPMETAVITGSGFEPGALLDIPVIRPDGTIVIIQDDGSEVEGWGTVQADGSGAFDDYKYRLNGLEGTYTVEVYPSPWGGPDSGEVPLATVTFTDSANFRLAQWSDVNSNWWFGNLNPTNSAYHEGESVPFMLKIETAVVGTTYDIGIRYNCDVGGKNAYDFLTRYDRDRGTAPALDPQGPGNATPAATAAINDDPSITYDNGESDRNWKLWGATFNSTPSGPTPSTDCPVGGEKTYNVSIQASATTVYMLWGGHLASAVDWGAGLGASSIGSASFYQGLSSSSCPVPNTCSVDRRIQGSAIGPATPQTADLKIVSMSVNSPPSSIPMSQDVQIHVMKVVHNNGPYAPVNARTTKIATAPPGCTVSPPSHVEVIAGMPESVDLTLDEPFVIHCYEPSSHTFSFDNVIEVATPNVTDPVSGNNTKHTELTVTSLTTADVKHVSWAPVSPPATMAVSQNVDVTFRKIIHNNGPWGPVDVWNDGFVFVFGCTAVPLSVPPLITGVPVSVDVSFDEVWTLHCTESGTKSFAFRNLIGPATPHVSDPDLGNPGCDPADHITWVLCGNNFAPHELRVEVLGNADVKKVSLEVLSPPTNIDVSQDVPITVRGVLHNNGPVAPVDVSDTLTAVAPPGCTVNPPVSVAARTLPVSVDVTVDTALTIHCSEPSTHTFNFANSVVITTPGIPEKDPTNNSKSTQLTVNVWAKADVKIASQSIVSPPADIDVSQNVPITVHKVLRNDGPYTGAVTSTLTSAASAPADCTVSAPPAPQQVNLPYSTDVTVDENYTIHCTTKSTHGPFTFDNTLSAPKDAHVTDPVPGNNSASTPLTVNVWALNDLKIVDQYLVSPPTQITMSQDVPITLNVVLHNNGPLAPVSATTNTTITVPPDCTVSPTSHVQQYSGVPVSVDVVHTEPFVIHCTKPSTHKFSFDTAITPKDPHVHDPVSGNNTAHTELTVAAVTQTDVKIVDEVFTVVPPKPLPVNTDVDVTLHKTIHNNGPYPAVDIANDGKVWPSHPQLCTAVPKTVPPVIYGVPVSVDVSFDEVWTIRCTVAGDYSFSFDNSIDVATAHVTDSNPANNIAHLELRDDVAVVDADSDGFTDVAESYLGTDPLHGCPDNTSDPAWPPDQDNNGTILIPDVTKYTGKLFTAVTCPSADPNCRLDLDTNGTILIPDVTKYTGKLFETCSQ